MWRIPVKAAAIALLVAALLTLSCAIPFNPLLLTLLPMTAIFPQIGQTGPAVEIGFAWLVVKQSWVWAAILAYYFVIVFLLATLYYVIQRTEERNISEAQRK